MKLIKLLYERLQIHVEHTNTIIQSECFVGFCYESPEKT